MFGALMSALVYLVVSAVVIAIVGGLVVWALGIFGITLSGGLLAALVNLIIAAAVLMIADKFLPGTEVHGFMGAIIAALAIGVVGWAVTWGLSLFGIVI